MRTLRDGIAIVGLVVVIGSVWLKWTSLPPVIPTHFGAWGPPNGFGPKSSLLSLPVIATLLYIGLTVAARFPRIFNYPVKVTEENIVRLRPTALALLGWVKAEVMWIFAWLTMTTISVALGRSSGLSPAFLPVTLVVMAGTTIYYWRRMVKLA